MAYNTTFGDNLSEQLALENYSIKASAPRATRRVFKVVPGSSHGMTLVHSQAHIYEPSGKPPLNPPQNPENRSQTTYIGDLCCGMGGISLAARDLGMEVGFGVDVNRGAIRTFEKNFPKAEAIEGSVRSSKVIERCEELLDEAKRGGHRTLVVSGPPCQGFSVAGSRDPCVGCYGERRKTWLGR